jgi:hypothetical protein
MLTMVVEARNDLKRHTLEVTTVDICIDIECTSAAQNRSENTDDFSTCPFDAYPYTYASMGPNRGPSADQIYLMPGYLPEPHEAPLGPSIPARACAHCNPLFRRSSATHSHQKLPQNRFAHICYPPNFKPIFRREVISKFLPLNENTS